MNAYMWNLENDTNEPICKAGIDTDVKNRHLDHVREGEDRTI